MTAIIHVNQHVIKANRKNGRTFPPCTTKQGSKNTYAHEAELVVDGRVVGRVVYSPDTPLSCGARLWVEWYEEIRPVVRADLDQPTENKVDMWRSPQVA